MKLLHRLLATAGLAALIAPQAVGRPATTAWTPRGRRRSQGSGWPRPASRRGAVASPDRRGGPGRPPGHRRGRRGGPAGDRGPGDRRGPGRVTPEQVAAQVAEPSARAAAGRRVGLDVAREHRQRGRGHRRGPLAGQGVSVDPRGGGLGRAGRLRGRGAARRLHAVRTADTAADARDVAAPDQGPTRLLRSGPARVPPPRRRGPDLPFRNEAVPRGTRARARPRPSRGAIPTTTTAPGGAVFPKGAREPARR
jgi:hypothetical protein